MRPVDDSWVGDQFKEAEEMERKRGPRRERLQLERSRRDRIGIEIGIGIGTAVRANDRRGDEITFSQLRLSWAKRTLSVVTVVTILLRQVMEN